MSDYTPTGNPATDADGVSADMRTEFGLIQTAVNSKVDENGALGTPTSGTLTNCTGLPAAGVSGTALVTAAIGTTVQAYDADLATWAAITPGTGVATALAVNVGSAGAPVVNGGALGTPSSGTLTNCSGTAASLTAGGNALLAGSASQAFAASQFTGNTATAYEVDASTTTQFQSHSNSANSTGMSSIKWRNQAASFAAYDFGKSRGAIGTCSALSQGEILGKVRFWGSGASAFAQGAEVRATVTEATPSNTAMGTKLEFLTSPNGSATPAVAVTIDQDKSLTGENAIVSKSATAGVGYTTGAGGTVTQATSKSTGVTLNKVCGEITMHNAALGAGSDVGFTLTNSAIAAGDVMVVNVVSAGFPNQYHVTPICASGSAAINVKNISTGSLSEAVILRFAVMKAVTS